MTLSGYLLIAVVIWTIYVCKVTGEHAEAKGYHPAWGWVSALAFGLIGLIVWAWLVPKR
jgi:hypothetical protein